MEGIIVSRFILFILVFVYLLIGYASKIDMYINAKVLDTAFAVQIVGLTAYIIYDNILAPPKDGWFFAILGYLFVYGIIIMVWFMYDFKTISPNKEYQLKEIKPAKITLKHPVDVEQYGALGMINEGRRSFYVCILGDKAFQKAKEGKPMTVRLKTTRSEDVPSPCSAVMTDVDET